MRLRVSVVTYLDDVRRQLHDVAVTVDVTATVGEVARGLVRAGAGHPRLLPFATHRRAQTTLLVTYPDGSTPCSSPRADRCCESCPFGVPSRMPPTPATKPSIG